MNIENKIEIIDTVSDVFLEIIDSFSLELHIDDGHSTFINVDKQYDRVVKSIEHKYFNKEIKFRLQSIEHVTNWNNNHQQKMLINNIDSVFKKLRFFENRIKILLPTYEFKYNNGNFVCIAFMNGGLYILPLFELNNIESDDRERMNRLGYDFSSYERNRDEIVNDPNVKISHIHIYFSISEPVEVLNKIKRFKFF